MTTIQPVAIQERAEQFYTHYQNLDLGNILSPSREEMIRIALYIEERLSMLPRVSNMAFDHEETGYARSIYYSSVTNTFFIRCKLKNKGVPLAGVYKFVKPKFYIAYHVNHPELICLANNGPLLRKIKKG